MSLERELGVARERGWDAFFDIYQPLIRVRAYENDEASAYLVRAARSLDNWTVRPAPNFYGRLLECWCPV